MRAIIYVFAFMALYVTVIGQIPKNAKVISVKGVGYEEVVHRLLDSGYVIEKRYNDLQTAKTEPRQYPKYWNAKYVLSVRVKDSIAYLSGTIVAGELFQNDPISNHVNRKGETLPKSIYGYPFLLMNKFALSFNKPVEYLKQ